MVETASFFGAGYYQRVLLLSFVRKNHGAGEPIAIMAPGRGGWPPPRHSEGTLFRKKLWPLACGGVPSQREGRSTYWPCWRTAYSLKKCFESAGRHFRGLRSHRLCEHFQMLLLPLLMALVPSLYASSATPDMIAPNGRQNHSGKYDGSSHKMNDQIERTAKMLPPALAALYVTGFLIAGYSGR